MSQINALVDLLANDPEIIALLDGLAPGGVPPTPAGGVFSSQIDPALFASEPGAFGGPLDPTASTIAEKTALLSRGIGTDRFGLEFAGRLGENPAGPPRLTDVFGGVGGPPRPAGDLPSPIDPSVTVAGLEQFLAGQREQVLGEQQATQQRIDQNQVQVQLNAEAAAQQNPVNQLIQQLANAFGGVHRIPPISSSFIGTEPLEGAIPGSQPSYGVNAGRFLVGRFGSQEEADQARDTLRSALQQGPAPPPTLGLFGGVLSPFGRTGAQQFDDLRQEESLTLRFRQEERRFQQLQRLAGPRGAAGPAGGGGAIGGGQPFRVVQRAVNLGGGQGFAMIESAQNLRVPDVAREGLTAEQANLLEILSGERSVGSIRRAQELAGDTEFAIGEMLRDDLIDTDEALVMEIMRHRLDNLKLDRENTKTVSTAIRRLGQRPVTRQEAANARAVLGVNRADSELMGMLDAEEAAVFEAAQRQRRGGQGDVRFRERESKIDRETRRQEALDVASGVREDARLERESRRNETRQNRLATIEAAAIAANDRNRISQIQQRIRPLMRELGQLQSALAAENRKVADPLAVAAGFPAGGPDPATMQAFVQQIEELDALIDQMIGSQTLTQGPDPRARVLRSQTQPVSR